MENYRESSGKISFAADEVVIDLRHWQFPVAKVLTRSNSRKDDCCGIPGSSGM
jgi:hypothetical protein